MPKKDTSDPIEKARKRLVKAQADLQEAQETRVRVKLAGEQAVDRARDHAARQLARATLAVEKRSAAVDEARQALDELRQQRARSVRHESSAHAGLQAVGRENNGDST